MLVISAVTASYRIIARTSEFGVQRETIAAIIPLAISPKQAHIMSDFIGVKSSATIPEIAMLFRRRSERPSSESAIVGFKGNHKSVNEKS